MTYMVHLYIQNNIDLRDYGAWALRFWHTSLRVTVSHVRESGGPVSVVQLRVWGDRLWGEAAPARAGPRRLDSRT